MSVPYEQASANPDPAAPEESSAAAEAQNKASEIAPDENRSFDHAIGQRLSERLNAATESEDPVQALDDAIQGMADELSHNLAVDTSELLPTEPGNVIPNAIETLVEVALEATDPVSALEEGAETLVEALAMRDLAVQEQQLAASARQVDQHAAYRHARFHRVSELMGVGYDLDQAVAITNANEAEIRGRAIAAGRDPMEPIYRYAVLNGYRGAPRAPAGVGYAPLRAAADAASRGHRSISVVEALSGLGDQEFADATKGERWQRLMGQ